MRHIVDEVENEPRIGADKRESGSDSELPLPDRLRLKLLLECFG